MKKLLQRIEPDPDKIGLYLLFIDLIRNFVVKIIIPAYQPDHEIKHGANKKWLRSV